MLLYGSLRSGAAGDPGAAYTLANYVRAYLDPALYRLFLNSILYAAGTCLVSFLIGTYLAWVSERTNTPLKRVFAILALVPFIPGILSTIAWLLLLSPQIGLINLVLWWAFGLPQSPFNIYTLGGMIWVEAIHLYPLVFLLMSAAFRSMDMSLEEALGRVRIGNVDHLSAGDPPAHAPGHGERHAHHVHQGHRVL